MVNTTNDEEPIVFQDTVLYREWGIRLTGIEEYDRAIDSFEKSKSSAESEDLRTLLGLCKALLKSTNYQQAVDVSQRCLNIGEQQHKHWHEFLPTIITIFSEPDNHKAMHMRSEALYNVGEFDYGLIHAHNGLRERKMPFQWSVYEGNETVETSVGKNTSAKALRLLLPWIFKMTEHRKVSISKLDEEEDELAGS